MNLINLTLHGKASQLDDRTISRTVSVMFSVTEDKKHHSFIHSVPLRVAYPCLMSAENMDSVWFFFNSFLRKGRGGGQGEEQWGREGTKISDTEQGAQC